MKISILLLLLAFVHSFAVASVPCEESPESAKITAQRMAFNQAIVDTDIKTMDKILTSDVILITGTESVVFSGKQAQLSLWEDDAKENGDAKTICDRVAQCIQVTSDEKMAMESGQWLCSNSGELTYKGIYSAKWRQIDGLWQIEAETFMTTEQLK
ncbi:nuclear transport factor 2 family protein [Glaciecola petra]|uniref:Nuclear transport factor 2 family protein n=1 Tax=Glaciecola petra TaxID=3075602 RepID=A0ABU2ZQ86_9ALTE|nr:nuclear transport factor 2 family protein [Aestuariibacter sp. P117]MDT0594795.1 nuclear transport factor 2 family protein [Aestuariibacter sp. P117]